jgi:hypothetical protein
MNTIVKGMKVKGMKNRLIPLSSIPLPYCPSIKTTFLLCVLCVLCG